MQRIIVLDHFARLHLMRCHGVLAPKFDGTLMRAGNIACRICAQIVSDVG